MHPSHCVDILADATWHYRRKTSGCLSATKLWSVYIKINVASSICMLVCTIMKFGNFIQMMVFNTKTNHTIFRTIGVGQGLYEDKLLFELISLAPLHWLYLFLRENKLCTAHRLSYWCCGAWFPVLTTYFTKLVVPRSCEFKANMSNCVLCD